MTIEVELLEQRIEHIDAVALLVPVDGAICKLGGAIASGLRGALSADERDDELDYLEHELTAMRPLVHPAAKAIDGVARWATLVVSAAYPHNVDGAIYGPGDCARMLRLALPVAFGVVHDLTLDTLAATLVGTAYRMPPDLAVRCFVDAIAASSPRSSFRLRWSLPDADHRRLAHAACKRLDVRLV